MSDDELTHDPDVQQVNSRLNESLEACRTIVAGYRAMLGAIANDNQPGAVRDGGGFVVAATDLEGV